MILKRIQIILYNQKRFLLLLSVTELNIIFKFKIIKSVDHNEKIFTYISPNPTIYHKISFVNKAKSQSSVF